MGYMSKNQDLGYTDRFVDRHIGPSDAEIQEMLDAIGYDSLDDLMDAAIPESIRFHDRLAIAEAVSEYEALAEARTIASKNKIYRSYLGMGYHDTITPPVIQRNVLENPGWYTAYTPYQAEIAQGRLEALLNFQTMTIDLTGLPIANASLLDEGTAAAEAMAMSWSVKGKRKEGGVFFVSELCHPQTIDVVRTRAQARGIELVIGDHNEFEFTPEVFGALLQYPATDGAVIDYREFCERAHEADALVTVAADLLSLVVLEAPGEWGADIVVGSTQRFGVPMGYGGPHAAYFATRDEYKRQIPGRIIGVSTDPDGEAALRMALQTREQHIRRERATSNICTAQVLLAVIASMYAVYHGPEGLRKIANRVHRMTRILAAGLERLGYEIAHDEFFDTIRVEVEDHAMRDGLLAAAREREINLRALADSAIGIALDETVRSTDLADLFAIFNGGAPAEFTPEEIAEGIPTEYEGILRRETEILTHPVFNRYHSETEMMRYIKRLEAKDLSLTTSMIPLGSCTMKLNATAEMMPITWPEFGKLHPFVPTDQAAGYQILFEQLEAQLAEITGFHSVSLQPNAGSQGEFAGLLVIKAYHESRGEGHRNICLIPASAHGTNPASAAMAGFRVVVVKSDENGNINVDDLREKAAEHSENLGAIMVTYPSTHGIFEEAIVEICEIVHEHGGQVYLDGANLNAMLGLARPGDFGADVCHLNLHKTFSIPHGGGGPGVGPICAAEHLAPFLPGNPVVEAGGEEAIGSISAAPWGSASILPISWAFIRMMGPDGLKKASEVAILAANYMARRLEDHYPVLYRGRNDTVAHECIIDPRPLRAETGVGAGDMAKRLMDYGFHAPTVSFPVAGTLMIEPTESESKEEIDRFCDALISIREEIQEIADGKYDKENNPIKRAPHTAQVVMADDWDRPYTREVAAFPAPWTRIHKYWPAVGLVDDAAGDRNLVCACPPIEEYELY